MLDVFITTHDRVQHDRFRHPRHRRMDPPVGAQGASLTARAFETALPGVGSAIVAISLGHVRLHHHPRLVRVRGTFRNIPVRGSGSEAFPYPLHHRRAHRALAQLDLVWILADTFNALMAFSPTSSACSC